MTKDIKKFEKRKWFTRATDFLLKYYFLFLFLFLFLFVIAVYLTTLKLTGILSVLVWILAAFFAGLFPLYVLFGILSLLNSTIKTLFDNKPSLPKLVFGYIGAIVAFLSLFSFIYLLFSTFHLGYLSFGNCSENFNHEYYKVTDGTIVKDPLNMIYFSAITFFTVGYGDICPVGVDRLVVVLNAWAGHGFTVLLLGLALAKYLKKK